METKLFLSIDMGTQSMRAMIVDNHGSILAFHQEKYDNPYFTDEPDHAEQDVEYYYEYLCKCTKALSIEHKDLMDQVIAFSFTGIRNSFVCLDENNKPLRRSILWLDKRVTTPTEKMPLFNRAVFKLVGMSGALNMIRSMSGCNHIAYGEPEIWEKTAKYVSIPCYLYYKLTGRLVDSVANPIGHIPYNYKKMEWNGPHDIKKPVFAVKDYMLPELIPTATVVGTITEKASEETGIPMGLELISGGSDKATETLGLSVISEDKAAISLGTCATVQFSSKKYFEPQPFLPSYCAVPTGTYNAEIQIERGYWLISWFKREFAQKEVEEARRLGCSAEDLLNKRLKEVPPGCRGLILQPYFCASYTSLNAKGAMLGLCDAHNRIYLYRAIIEGIGFALLAGLKQMERRSGQRIKEVYIAGGGSQSDEICQITADLFGLTVKRIQSFEVCGIGCALNGFVGKGVFASYEEACQEMVHVKDTFIPDPETHKIYAKLYKEVYCNIYKHNLPLYKRIRKIVKEKQF